MQATFLCCSHSWGGLELNTIRLSKWLQARGHDILLITYDKSRMYQEATNEGIPTEVFEYQRRHLDFGAAKQLAQRLQDKGRTSLIIAHYDQAYLAALAKYRHFPKLKLAYWQHMQYNLIKKSIYHRWMYRQIDAWITPLSYLQQQLFQHTTLKAAQIQLIPMCIDTRPFVENPLSMSEAREVLDLPKGVFLAGTIGRIDRQKGQEYSIMALEQLPYDDLHLAIIGEETLEQPGYEERLRELAMSLGVSERVHFRPFTRNVAAAFRALDVFVMSSLSEPIGMVTLEAMASGTPVIGTNTGGTPDLLLQGSCGLLVPPADPESLTNALQIYYLDRDLRQKATDRAREHVIKNYHYEAQCDGFEQIMAQW
ncbi:glycosyltransferase family 4 protein [Eisenibacter elegans]|jgi:glycosyltransferase involved in cell wall biosynthesis|uniref:glycosyltransferase family 4 protein n=1 Tax=Eisenibacter elegans TaxID=997 RepID=UPI0003F896B4|nr:glycosyltransferase family 4 protein [Eisenibacter elegans]